MLVPVDAETIPSSLEDEDSLKKAIAETIEAPAQMKKQETIDAWHAGEGKYEGEKLQLIEKKFRDRSFDGAKGQICSLSWSMGLDEEPRSLFATPGKITERELLVLFFADLKLNLKDRPPYFIGHFISGFDLPFIFQRAVINGVNPGMSLGQWGRHDQHFFDTMIAWAGYKGTISQDNLCAALGIEIDNPDDMDGSKVWDAYKAGEYKKIETYNCVDLKKVQAMYKRIAFA